MEARHRAALSEIEKNRMEVLSHQWRAGATTAGFALQIVNTPGKPARQGSADELAALGLDWLACLAVGINYQGEASLRSRGSTKRFTNRASSWKMNS